MSSLSISPSLPCDNDSEFSSSMNEDVPEVLEGEFIPKKTKKTKRRSP